MTDRNIPQGEDSQDTAIEVTILRPQKGITVRGEPLKDAQKYRVTERFSV